MLGAGSWWWCSDLMNSSGSQCKQMTCCPAILWCVRGPRKSLEWGAMMSSPSGPLLNYLPAIYHTSEALGQLLAVFEAVLFGVDRKEWGTARRRQSLSELLPIVDSIAAIASLFDVYETPK